MTASNCERARQHKMAAFERTLPARLAGTSRYTANVSVATIYNLLLHSPPPP